MVEGGGSVNTQFLTRDLADELQLVVAPLFVGDSQARRFVDDGAFPWHPERRRRWRRLGASATSSSCATRSRRASTERRWGSDEPPSARRHDPQRAEKVPLRLADGFATTARVLTFGLVDGREHLALGLGDRAARLRVVRRPEGADPGPRPQRVPHRDVLGSRRCDCGPHRRGDPAHLGCRRLPALPASRRAAASALRQAGRLRAPGRPWTRTRPTCPSATATTCATTVAAQMLHTLGVTRISLLMTAQTRQSQLRRHGVVATEQVPTGVYLSTANARYLGEGAARRPHARRTGARRTRASTWPGSLGCPGRGEVSSLNRATFGSRRLAPGCASRSNWVGLATDRTILGQTAGGRPWLPTVSSSHSSGDNDCMGVHEHVTNGRSRRQPSCRHSTSSAIKSELEFLSMDMGGIRGILDIQVVQVRPGPVVRRSAGRLRGRVVGLAVGRGPSAHGVAGDVLAAVVAEWRAEDGPCGADSTVRPAPWGRAGWGDPLGNRWSMHRLGRALLMVLTAAS